MRNTETKKIEYYYNFAEKVWVKHIELTFSNATFVRKCSSKFLVGTHINHFYYVAREFFRGELWRSVNES